jgi:hypothetical protein
VIAFHFFCFVCFCFWWDQVFYPGLHARKAGTLPPVHFAVYFGDEVLWTISKG